jgi:ubiquinone/menaquinone biosynthesis C-methylase UbiE
MLTQARQIASERGIENIRFELIDASNIPYPDASIDLVTCRTAPHHFPDIGAFLSEVHRVLTPSGTFLLCDTTTSENAVLAKWHQRAEALRDPTHAYAPSPSEWRELIGSAGFHITHEESTRVNMTFWDWVERSQTPDTVSTPLHQDFVKAKPSVKQEYGIEAIENDDFKFHWPVYNCRAVKT